MPGGSSGRASGAPRLPYLIYDTVDATEDAVVIVTVRHAARRRLT